MSKKIFIETYGCQMNVYDTELVQSILSNANHHLVDSEDVADLVMLNTCSVRDNANRKVFNRIHAIKNKRGDDSVKIGVLGCMATNFRKKLLDNPKLKIDLISGPDNYKQLPELIDNLYETGDKQFKATLSEFETYSDITPTRNEGPNAWIAIMRGCNNYCTFCVVPHTRGRERSRDPYNIVEEVKDLVSKGFKQVTLLGQNVNSYSFEDYDFADLLKMVSDVEGIKRIRYTSPHPKDYPRKLLKIMAERDNICKQLHMPLQAGNDRVLEKMNRTYTSEEFLDIVREAREVMPDVMITTDIIVGFPSETKEEFEDTVKVTEAARFDSAFIFKYSPRPNTIAMKRFPDDVKEEEKTRRILRLNEIQDKIRLESNQSDIGKDEELLIEVLESKRNPNISIGRTDGGKMVQLPKGDFKVGDFVMATITDASPHFLVAHAIAS